MQYCSPPNENENLSDYREFYQAILATLNLGRPRSVFFGYRRIFHDSFGTFICSLSVDPPPLLHYNIGWLVPNRV